jgi:hypothetical protein
MIVEHRCNSNTHGFFRRIGTQYLTRSTWLCLVSRQPPDHAPMEIAIARRDGFASSPMVCPHHIRGAMVGSASTRVCMRLSRASLTTLPGTQRGRSERLSPARNYTQGQDSCMNDQSWYAVVRVIYSPSSDGVCEEELSASLGPTTPATPQAGQTLHAIRSLTRARLGFLRPPLPACQALLYYCCGILPFHCLSLQLALFWM